MLGFSGKNRGDGRRVRFRIRLGTGYPKRGLVKNKVVQPHPADNFLEPGFEKLFYEDSFIGPVLLDPPLGSPVGFGPRLSGLGPRLS